MSTPAGVLLLTAAEVRSLLDVDDVIEALEAAYLAVAAGRGGGATVLSVESAGGVVHAKAARLDLDGPLVAVKVNGNYPANAERFGLPTIHGLIVLLDGERGLPLAVMDATEITRLRTGATTAVAARRLARPDSRVVTICGCGVQGRVQLEALRRVLPLERAYAWDLDASRAHSFAAETRTSLGLEVQPVSAPGPAARRSDVCVTCTPSRRAFLTAADVRPGTFVVAVGADHPAKQELDPKLVAAATLVVDDLESCAAAGELHHALHEGLTTRERVHAELADLVAGTRPGRTSAEETVVFDSTGSAVQDAAAAARVHIAARAASCGRVVAFFDGVAPGVRSHPGAAAPVPSPAAPP